MLWDLLRRNVIGGERPDRINHIGLQLGIDFASIQTPSNSPIIILYCCCHDIIFGMFQCCKSSCSGFLAFRSGELKAGAGILKFLIVPHVVVPNHFFLCCSGRDREKSVACARCQSARAETFALAWDMTYFREWNITWEIFSITLSLCDFGESFPAASGKCQQISGCVSCTTKSPERNRKRFVPSYYVDTVGNTTWVESIRGRFLYMDEPAEQAENTTWVRSICDHCLHIDRWVSWARWELHFRLLQHILHRVPSTFPDITTLA